MVQSGDEYIKQKKKHRQKKPSIHILCLCVCINKKLVTAFLSLCSSSGLTISSMFSAPKYGYYSSLLVEKAMLLFFSMGAICISMHI